MKETIESCLNVRSGVLLIISGYILGRLWRKDCANLFGSYSKDDEGNISQGGSAILMKFGSLDDLQNCIKLIYYNIQ